MTERETACGKCANFVRLNPNDLTAPEGTCQLEKWPASWPMSYWPNMLAGDFCLNGFEPALTTVEQRKSF